MLIEIPFREIFDIKHFLGIALTKYFDKFHLGINIWQAYIRGRCQHARKHFFLQILSRHMYFFVFLNFKRGFFSWTFWFGASFICKNAHLCLHADLHGEVGQNILNGQTNMLTRRTSDFSVTYHLEIPILLL